jgi:hypothetical protein
MINLAYCDFIAATISKSLLAEAKQIGSLIKSASHPQMDLHPAEGYFLSTRKTIEVEDCNGKQYKITVEEV